MHSSAVDNVKYSPLQKGQSTKHRLVKIGMGKSNSDENEVWLNSGLKSLNSLRNDCPIFGLLKPGAGTIKLEITSSFIASLSLGGGGQTKLSMISSVAFFMVVIQSGGSEKGTNGFLC